MIENLKFTVSSTPHIREKNSIDDIMLDVILALMPAAFAGVYLFGPRALAILFVSVISCVVFEAGYQKIAHKKVTINDLSAIVTGMLLAFTLPVTVPFYVVIIGSFIAIVITKQLFGGLGQNFMNPALIGRAFLLASFPVQMTTYIFGRMGVSEKIPEALTGATPLSAEYTGRAPYSIEHLLGSFSDGTPIAGSIGETCIIAIFIGFIYLLIRRVISIRIPLTYVATVLIMAYLFDGKCADINVNPVNSILSGGVMFGAIFMATDYVTSPTTKWGQVIFGIGCGALTSIIRTWGGYPEGVTYAILIMNVLTPLLDKWTLPKPFGGVSKKGV